MGGGLELVPLAGGQRVGAHAVDAVAQAGHPVYPSSIVVSGLTGTVTDVNVRLLGITTSGDNNSPPEHWIEDIDVMVDAPNDSNVILMSDARWQQLQHGPPAQRCRPRLRRASDEPAPRRHQHR